jgi:Ca2+-binding RTX toxin-like protein
MIVVNEVNTQLDLTVTGHAAGVRGQPLSFTFTVAGAAAGNVSYAIDWNGDGTVDQTVVGGTSVRVEHVYTNTGSYTISAIATDSSGKSSAAATHGVSIAKWAVQNDATGARMLVIGGTEWADMIELKPRSDNSIRVNLNYSSFDVVVRGSGVVPISRVIVYGQAGDDWVKISTKSEMPTLHAELHGGFGNDKLRGGNGDDLILGGPGDDLLVGHRGRDFLIGGSGRDRIVGNEHDDILISGFTSYDLNVAALESIFKEWKSGRSYNERVANLRGTGSGAAFASRLNGNNFLLNEGAATNVFDDGVSDHLAGDGGMDFYFANLSLDGNDDAQKKDKIVGLSDAEFAMDLDFILNDE